MKVFDKNGDNYVSRYIGLGLANWVGQSNQREMAEKGFKVITAPLLFGNWQNHLEQRFPLVKLCKDAQNLFSKLSKQTKFCFFFFLYTG